MILLARSGESLSVWYLVVACCINEQVFVSWKYHSSIQEDKRNWIGFSIVVFFDGSITALIMLSFSLYSSSTILIFHLPLCLLSPFIHATSSIAISMCLVVFRTVSFTQVLFIPSIQGCIFTMFDISLCFLMFLNNLAIIVKLFFWYCNCLSMY